MGNGVVTGTFGFNDIGWCFLVLDVGWVLSCCLDDANYEALGFAI
jgi:hypothetical protein